MKQMFCTNCGGDEFIESDGYRICRYCKSKFAIDSSETKKTNSNIALNDDVQRLLRVCEENPSQASRYAGLILDIDPTNREAMKYLGRRR